MGKDQARFKMVQRLYKGPDLGFLIRDGRVTNQVPWIDPSNKVRPCNVSSMVGSVHVVQISQ